MAERRNDGKGVLGLLAVVGPGVAIAATGVGAGDLVAAAVSGSRFGFAVVWAAVAGAGLKFVLNEGLARWQLATGTTLLEGWAEHLGRWVQYAFMIYLVIWSFVVGGALISACGLAGHALVPALSVEAWGVVHSIVAALFVLAGGYKPFELLVKIVIAVMFVTLVGSAVLVDSPVVSMVRTVGEASIPRDGVRYILGVIGGVGGSVTMLSYGYWIREKGWVGKSSLRTVRVDLAVAYVLTGVFGVAMMVLAAHVLHGTGAEIKGAGGALTMSDMVGDVLGRAGRVTFLVGFWGAVFTSMLGVWQGLPYLFVDFVALLRGTSREDRLERLSTRSPWYRGFLAWLALPPLALLYFERPVGLIVVYAVLSALFMPFLAATLLYMNGSRRRKKHDLRNGWASIAVLLLCVALFGYLLVQKLIETVG
ncbi:MAG: divalent metal cation transporter [bacterium]|nr:divalent metal cation transporter [bacterium]